MRAWDDDNHPITCEEEMTALRRIATGSRVYIGLVSVLPTVSDDLGCMTGFTLDFRGFYSFHTSELAKGNQIRTPESPVGAVLSAMLYAMPIWGDVSPINVAPSVGTMQRFVENRPVPRAIRAKPPVD